MEVVEETSSSCPVDDGNAHDDDDPIIDPNDDIENNRIVKADDDADKIKYSRDGTQLLSIFPAEIWTKIMNNVKDSPDLQNISNASLFFRNMLLSERVLFLFPEVWKILDFQHHQKNSKSMDAIPKLSIRFEENGVTYKKCETCYRWNPTWWYSAALQLRLVCREWNTVLDQFLQTFPSEYDTDSGISDPEKTTINCTSHYTDILALFADSELGLIEMEMFCFGVSQKTHSPETGRSPFLSRSVQLDIASASDAGRRDNLPNQYCRILEKYGRHILYGHVIMQASGSMLTDSYSELHKLLGLLPNLKVLRIVCDEEKDGTNAEEITDFEENVRLNPLPELGDLQMISTCNFPAPLFNKLIAKYNQVPVIEIYEDIDNDQKHYAIDTTPLPELKQFSMRIFSLNEYALLTSPQLNWTKLTNLSLDLMASNGDLEWHLIFDLLEKFQNTLKYLALKLAISNYYGNKTIKSSHRLSLNLLNIVTLNLTLTNMCSLDFILPMRNSLEFLVISVLYPMTDEGRWNQQKAMSLGNGFKKEMKFLRCSSKLSKSNFWDLFPKLKCIKFKEGFEWFGKDEEKNPGLISKQTWKRNHRKSD